jgi:membrane protein DedA with SNARE-associated domain
MNPTVRGIGIRALILILVVVIVGGWLALKVIGAAFHLAFIIVMVLIVAVVLAYIAYRVKRRD